MIQINGKDYKELRCARCQKLLAYQNVKAGVLFIECNRCDHPNEFVFKYYKNDENVSEIKKNYQIEMKGGGYD